MGAWVRGVLFQGEFSNTTMCCLKETHGHARYARGPMRKVDRQCHRRVTGSRERGTERGAQVVERWIDSVTDVSQVVESGMAQAG